MIALANLAAIEDPAELSDGEQPVIVFLLDCLCYDESPYVTLTIYDSFEVTLSPTINDVNREVRRAALLHIPVLSNTLSILLSRTRDVDVLNRKLVYATVLLKLDHPKRMTISQRELVVRQGLGDREDTVRMAAAKLLNTWLDFYKGDLVQFLKIFDIITGEVAADALRSVFLTRPETLDVCTFDGKS